MHNGSSNLHDNDNNETILRMSMLKWRTILMMIRGARAEINTFMFHEIDKLVYRVDTLF